MMLITAALEEELKAGMELCRNRRRICGSSANLYEAVRNDQKLLFLRTGVGPRRSGASLEAALKVIKPARIMVVGYAGAIDPELRLGDLVAVAKATAFSLNKAHPDWEHIQPGDSFALANYEELEASAKSAGLNARIGDTLTSSHVLGEPAHKLHLYENLRGSIVDMETAALARVALANAIPLCCIRVVSDEVTDSFLAPFSYNPSATIHSRARELLGSWKMHAYREWRRHAGVARGILVRFLSHYL